MARIEERYATAEEAIGIDVPIVPGVMPILSLDGIKRMTQLTAATLPEGLERELEARRGDEVAVAELGVSYATLQCAAVGAIARLS